MRSSADALLGFRTAFANADFEAAYAHVVAALETNPVAAWQGIVGTCSLAFVNVIGAVKKEAELLALLSSLHSSFPDMIFIPPPTRRPWILEKIKAQRAGNIDKGLPYFLFVPQAKSGSTFLGRFVPQGFSLTCTTYSAINLQVVPSWAKVYRLGGSAYVTHLLPTPSNVALLLEADLKRVVVNTRDPRQIYLSGLHHFLKYRSDFPDLEKIGYFSWSLRDQALFNLPGYRRTVIDWLSGWVAAENSGLEILFTTYERFMSDPDRQIEELLGFYGGDVRHFDRAAAYSTHVDVDYHFRKGEVDEWRTVFEPEVVEQLNAAIPDEWFEGLNWKV